MSRARNAAVQCTDERLVDAAHRTPKRDSVITIVFSGLDGFAKMHQVRQQSPF